MTEPCPASKDYKALYYSMVFEFAREKVEYDDTTVVEASADKFYKRSAVWERDVETLVKFMRALRQRRRCRKSVTKLNNRLDAMKNKPYADLWQAVFGEEIEAAKRAYEASKKEVADIVKAREGFLSAVHPTGLAQASTPGD